MNSYLYLWDFNDNCVGFCGHNITYTVYWHCFMFYLQLFVFTTQNTMQSQLEYSSLLPSTWKTVNTKLKSSLCKEFHLFYCCLYLGVFWTLSHPLSVHFCWKYCAMTCYKGQSGLPTNNLNSENLILYIMHWDFLTL